jgi:hypothetical protein
MEGAAGVAEGGGVMDDITSRQQFEAHILRETPEAHINHNALGDYECHGVQREWRTWQKAQEAENEACALTCDSVNNYDNPMTARDCADAIRARHSNAN